MLIWLVRRDSIGRGRTSRPSKSQGRAVFRVRVVLRSTSLHPFRAFPLLPLGARRRCRRGADVAPAWALLRDRHAAHRLQRANRLSAMGLGGRSVRALRADRTRLALVLSAIPHEQGAVLLPRTGCGGRRLSGSVEAASQPPRLPPAGIAG